MAWALVKPWANNSILFKAERKYNLLKSLETKEHITKKTVKQYKDGDKITVIYRKKFQTWKTDNRGHLYKEWVESVEERTYVLKEFTIQFKN